MNQILSYKGLLEDGGQDTILLSTKKGEKGYRIVKFQLFPQNPGEANAESTMKIYKNEQSGVDQFVDFSDNRILGVATIGNSTAGNVYPPILSVVFDQEIFNQDIYITHMETSGNQSCNYYLELEVIMLNETEATVATLKDIRNNQ